MRYGRANGRTDGTEIIGPSGKIPGTNKLVGNQWEILRYTFKNLSLNKRMAHFINSIKFFFFKQKTAYEIGVRLVGSEMCIRDSD